MNQQLTQQTKLSAKQLLNDQSVQARFEKMLGKNASSFTTSVLQIVNSNSLLKNAEPETILSAAFMAASLNLPINNNLGFAYIVPYSNNYRDENGKWQKRQEAQFQLGYKGFIQLAQRSGQFKRINACAVYDGDDDQSILNRLTALIPKAPPSETVVGYIAYFQLLNGYEAHLSMSKEELLSHASKYSQSFKSAQANAEKYNKPASSVWHDNFDSMAQKTVIKLLLSKQAPLSIDSQLSQAVQADQAVIRDVDGATTFDYPDNQSEPLTIEMNLDNDPALLETVVSQIKNGTLDKAHVLSGQAGYTFGEQAQQVLAGA